MRPLAFAYYAVISGLLWGICYPGTGYLGGTSWQHAETLAAQLGLLIAISVVVFLAIAWLRHRFLPRKDVRQAREAGKPNLDS